jgi:vesicle-fusing ATPase
VLLVLLKKQPPKGRRLLVVGTTSAPAVMEDMGIAATCNVCLNVPALREADVRAVLAELKAFAPQDVRPIPPLAASFSSGTSL